MDLLEMEFFEKESTRLPTPIKAVREQGEETRGKVGGGRFLQLHNLNFDLIVNILIGIRRTVANLVETPGTLIDDRQFRKKISSENDWISAQSKGSQVCKFIDYAPLVFQRLR